MKITKTQLKQIIKEELDDTLKEAGSPGLLRSLWNMLQDEFEKEDPGYERDAHTLQDDPSYEEPRPLTPEEEEEQRQIKAAEKARRASSARDAYYRGGTYDPTLEEVIRQEVRKLLRGK